MNTKRLGYAVTFLAVVVAGLLALQAIHAETALQQRGGDQSSPSDRRNPHVASVDLGQNRQAVPDGLTADEIEFRRAHPELFETKGQIVTWSASWCGPCRTQKVHTKALKGRFNVVEYDYDQEEAKALYERFGGGDGGIPYTAIVVEGKLKKGFHGVTPAREIQQYAADCLKQKDDEDVDESEKHVNVGPLHIDWSDGVDLYIKRRDRDGDTE